MKAILITENVEALAFKYSNNLFASHKKSTFMKPLPHLKKLLDGLRTIVGLDQQYKRYVRNIIDIYPIINSVSPKRSAEIHKSLFGNLAVDLGEVMWKASSSKVKSITYFKRAVLAAEIVTKLKDERTFGRVKFQKIEYICEHVSELKLSKRYLKFAAGPFDNKFMHSINKEFKKQKWFDVVELVNGDFKVPKYIPLENAEDYKNYYIRYFSEFDEDIQFVIELFRLKKTDETELAATVLACVLELKNINAKLQWQSLFNLFYSWHDKKKRFTEERIKQSFIMLNENNLLPEVTID